MTYLVMTDDIIGITSRLFLSIHLAETTYYKFETEFYVLILHVNFDFISSELSYTD